MSQPLDKPEAIKTENEEPQPVQTNQVSQFILSTLWYQRRLYYERKLTYTNDDHYSDDDR